MAKSVAQGLDRGVQICSDGCHNTEEQLRMWNTLDNFGHLGTAPFTLRSCFVSRMNQLRIAAMDRRTKDDEPARSRDGDEDDLEENSRRVAGWLEQFIESQRSLIASQPLADVAPRRKYEADRA